MCDRDTLAELINLHQPAARGFWCSCGEALDCHIDQHRAAVVIAAGWRPPARRIETPAELDALPEGAVVRTAEGRIAEKTCHYGAADRHGFRSDWAETQDDDIPIGTDELDDLPAIVLWEPEEVTSGE
ncbi:hypothetical protein [Nocardia xishanensis]|uniref:hypothetical protein n=1 Tax=Nocardia xishanensis TaxID=238964 RepID=UPI00082F91CE|nr:hypothetical protein [Nocardia xishanensis]